MVESATTEVAAVALLQVPQRVEGAVAVARVVARRHLIPGLLQTAAAVLPVNRAKV